MDTSWKIDLAHVQITLEHVREKDWVYVKYCGHIHPDEAILAGVKYLELQKELHCPKILNDKSEVTGDWEDANDWLQYEWLPQALAYGLTHFAMVLSKDLHDLAPSQDLQRRFEPGCEVKLFRGLPDAANWLQSV